MIAYSIEEKDGIITIETSDGHAASVTTLEDALRFLAERPGVTGFRVIWDLDECVAPLLKLLPEIKQRELFGYGRVNVEAFGMLYNYKKNFAVRYKHEQVNFYHLSQYFPELAKPPLDQVQRLGQKLLDELASIKVKPKSLSSGIAIFDNFFEPLPFPEWEDVPDEVSDFALECSGRAWTEAHQIGRWDVAYDMDIINAYASKLAGLYDTRYGEWVNQVERPAGAVYGFVYGSISIPAAGGKVSPAIFLTGEGHGLSVTGRWTDYMTIDKLDCLRRHGIGDMVVKDAWYWIPVKKVQPLYVTLVWLYKQRSTSPLLNRVIKLGVNGLYGRFLQVYPDGKFGKRFFPVWGALAEERTAVQVADFIYDRGLVDNVIHIATDGVLFDKPAGEVAGVGIGEWKQDSSGPAIVIDSSTVFYGAKRPHSLTYDMALEMIQSDPQAAEWHRKITRRMTLGDVLQGTAASLGDFKEVETGFRLKSQPEHDRVFDTLPRSGDELLGGVYKSKPWKASKQKQYTMKGGAEE